MKKLSNEELLVELKVPFPFDQVLWRVTNTANNRTRGQVVPYQPVVKVWIPAQKLSKYPQSLFLECVYGNGDAQAAGEARRHLDCSHGTDFGSGASVLPGTERVAGGGGVRSICGESVCEVLCRQKRTAVADPGHLLPVAADRLFRGHRQRARDRLAYGGLAGAAAVCGHRAGRGYAGPFDDFAHAAADRCGNASGSVRLGAEPAGGSWASTGAADRH